MKYYLAKSERTQFNVPGCPTEVIWAAFATKGAVNSKAWNQAKWKAFQEQYPSWACPYELFRSGKATKLDHLRHGWSTPTGGEFIEIPEEAFNKMMRR